MHQTDLLRNVKERYNIYIWVKKMLFELATTSKIILQLTDYQNNTKWELFDVGGYVE